MNTTHAIGIGLSIALASACAGPVSPNGLSGPRPNRATISVINNSPQDVRVFVEPGGYPLGRITALERKSFELPPAMSTSVIRLRIHPFGARYSFTTAELTLETGRQFELRVVRPLSASQIVIR